jgi:magnesium chelatase family protein
VAALVGGAALRPGEVTLAHRGILLLDELPEFTRPALEALRLPLEDGEVLISRAAGAVRMPARCLVVAAMNPCPCGHLGDGAVECRCSIPRMTAYRMRISGPLLDRFDLRIEVPRAAAHGEPGESTSVVAARVARARGLLAATGSHHLPEAEELLERATETRMLSGRGAARARRVAATVAALAGRDRVEADDVAEALSYRVELR